MGNIFRKDTSFLVLSMTKQVFTFGNAAISVHRIRPANITEQDMSQSPKILILCTCLLSLGLRGSGQDQLSYGARIGTSLAAFTSASSLETGGNAGFQVGGFADYVLNDQFYLTGSAGYSLLTPALTAAPAVSGSVLIARTNIYQMNLAEAFVGASYKLPLTFLGGLRPSIVAGHSFAYNFYTNQKHKTTLYYPAATYSATGNERVTSAFNPILYAVQAALRFDILISDAPFNTFVVELGYKYTYNQVLNSLGSFSTSRSADDFKMNVAYLSLGVKF